jgi:hypothetical protein
MKSLKLLLFSRKQKNNSKSATSPRQTPVYQAKHIPAAPLFVKKKLLDKSHICDIMPFACQMARHYGCLLKTTLKKQGVI